jgi:hypothetical protein
LVERGQGFGFPLYIRGDSGLRKEKVFFLHELKEGRMRRSFFLREMRWDWMRVAHAGWCVLFTLALCAAVGDPWEPEDVIAVSLEEEEVFFLPDREADRRSY